jgi:hypothetical protein
MRLPETSFEHDRASFGNRLMWLPVAVDVHPATRAAG